MYRRRLAKRKELNRIGGCGAIPRFEWRDVVQDDHAASVRSEDEVVRPLVHNHTIDDDPRQRAARKRPVASAVGCPIQTELRAREEQLWIARILGNALHRAAWRQVAHDRRPRHAAVDGLEQIWPR